MRLQFKILEKDGKQYAILSAVITHNDSILATVNDGGRENSLLRITPQEYESARQAIFDEVLRFARVV